MEGEAGGRRRARHSVGVILLLCSLASSFTCFSLQKLSKKVKQDKGDNEAPAIDVTTGSIVFNGKELNSASATAPRNDGLLHDDLYQSDGTEMLELENDLSKEAEWRRLNSSLHCHLNTMKLKFMGLSAADLQLDMGDTPPFPLMQVPETCGYSVQQTELGLDLVVPYDGCNVIQENERHVLQMIWNETPVKFACPMLPSPDSTPASTASEPLPQPWKVPFPHRPFSLRRSKRHVNSNPSIYDPNYLSYCYFLHYLYLSQLSNPNTTPPPPPPPPPRPPPPYLHYPHSHNNPQYPYYHYPTTTTAKPTTTTASTTTKCSRRTTATTEYPGQIGQYVPFHKLPFPVQISHFQRAGKFLDHQKSIPEAFSKSGFQDQALSGVQWHPVPSFPFSVGQDDYQFDWQHLQPAV